MAKKKRDYRAEAAHRKNVEQAQYLKQAAKRKAFWNAHKKQILIGGAAVILAAILIWLGCKFFVGPGGSIPNWFGTLRGVEENWIVQNLGSGNSDARYYKLAEYDQPEGYTLDPEYKISADKLNKSRYFEADSEDKLIQTVYVGGVKNMTGAAQVEYLKGAGLFENIGEETTATLGGYDVNYMYTVTDDTPDVEDEASKEGYASLCVYVDTVQNTSVMLMMNSAHVPLAEVPSCEDMLAQADSLVALLKVEK